MIEVRASGHSNVACLHKTTLEFTKEADLTPRGDCIFAVSSDTALKDLPQQFKDALHKGAALTVTIECGGLKDTVKARGSPELTLEDPEEAVIRKSDFICGRTLAIGADKGAADLDRGLVAAIQAGNPVIIKLELN